MAIFYHRPSHAPNGRVKSPIPQHSKKEKIYISRFVSRFVSNWGTRYRAVPKRSGRLPQKEGVVCQRCLPILIARAKRERKRKDISNPHIGQQSAGTRNCFCLTASFKKGNRFPHHKKTGRVVTAVLCLAAGLCLWLSQHQFSFLDALPACGLCLCLCLCLSLPLPLQQQLFELSVVAALFYCL
jgi:hypothetical protein